VNYEYDFDPAEPNNTAAAVYRQARRGGTRVLDLGSGPGIVAAQLVATDGKAVVCVDESAAALEAARSRGIETVIEADLAEPTWVQAVSGDEFDVIILADVLEHLVDPGALLQTIADEGLLAGDGRLVVSIPNAGHEAVLAELINGRFTYQDTGLLDSTHLRFFTLTSLRQLLERSGFFISAVERTKRTAEQTSLAVHDLGLSPELRDLILEAADEAQTYQFIVTARHADAAAELAEVREALQTVRARLAEQGRMVVREGNPDLRAQRDAAIAEAEEAERDLQEALVEKAEIERRLAELESALDRERKLTATERKRCEQLLARAKHQEEASADTNRTIARLEKELRDVYRSKTWKVGRAAWTAFHAPARLAQRLRRSPQAPPVDSPISAVRRQSAMYELVEDAKMRHSYEQALNRTGFSGTKRAAVFAVSTTDLDEGRGDLFTAIGLGRELERIGFEVIYVSRAQWYELPPGAEIVVAMLETFDCSRTPSDITKVAWIRNQTDAWFEQPSLPLFDLVLTSSEATRNRVAARYAGPMAVFPIGVDADLFQGQARPERRHGVVATVNQWGREREVYGFLKERTPDFELVLFGQQRGIAPELKPYTRGPVSFFSLPSLYRQARIVLDDFNHTTAPYGNVNSRLFEAAAVGAIVLTNRETGLSALGLDEIPVFSTARELFELIERNLDDDEAFETVEALQRVVLQRHTYKQRATEFEKHLASAADRPADDAIVISYYPDYRDNPYTEMMWSDLRRRRSIAIPVGNDLSFTATVRAADHRPTVFHLNWTAPILGGATDEHDRLVRHRRFVEAIDEMHEHGIRSVWTIHNVLPHECADPELEAQLRQEIADRVDIIHVMCEETVAACRDWYQLPTSKVRVVPHPSYIDIYPNLIDRSAARRELSLGDRDFIYLCFGQIRPYKGIDRLLDAFENVAQMDPESRLLLVGKTGRFEGVRQIADRARAHPQIVGYLNPIPDADIQLYMNAADVVVLPYQSALNSGAMLLAYSFARPVIAPETGCLGGLVDDRSGVTFDSAGGTLALQNALLSARALSDDHGAAAFARAEQLHYLGISKQFAEIVGSLS